jgi:hypothetical protein
MVLYAQDYHGTFPTTDCSSMTDVVAEYNSATPASSYVCNLKSGAETDVDLGSKTSGTVSMMLWKLVVAEVAQPDIFHCQSSEQAGQKVNLRDTNNNTEQGPGSFIDFPYYETAAYVPSGAVTTKSISYSFIQPYSSFGGSKGSWDQWGADADPRMVIGGDQNNGSDPTAGTPATSGNYTTIPSSTMKASVNSKNHTGDGQNCMYGDGHVSFEKSAYVGIGNDNIFTSRVDSTPSVSPSGVAGVMKVKPLADTANWDTVLIPVQKNMSDTKF